MYNLVFRGCKLPLFLNIPFNLQNLYFWNSIGNCIAYANLANIEQTSSFLLSSVTKETVGLSLFVMQYSVMYSCEFDFALCLVFSTESLKNHHIHHRSGLPAKFWVTIAFLIVGFHLYLAKLIYSECFKEKDIVRSKIYMS